MIAEFKSYSEGDICSFKSEAWYVEDGSISLINPNDQSMINYRIYNDTLILKRQGSVSQNLYFNLKKITPSTYSGQGFVFNFKVKTLSLKLNMEAIYVHYELYEAENLISTHKIWLNIRK